MAVDHNNPQSRDEEILIATIDGTEYNKLPQSRMEELLLELKEVIEEGGGGGTTDYENLSNQPQVNGETLIGDKSGADLGLVDAEEGKGLSTNDYDDTEKAAVAAATSAISAIKDGTVIDSFGDVEVALLDKADISDLGTAAAKDSTNAVTSGSTDLVESGAVKEAIDAAVSAAYHHAGTKTVAQLTHDLLVAANEGNVYNITDSGTTTSDFIEGIGKTIDEGSNVGICKVGNEYMFDLLSGFVDTTNFVQKSVTAGLLKNDGTVDTTIQGDVSSLKSGLTNLDNEVNGDATVYPYSDVITIEDAIPANVADCTVKIEPVQDLHGYDKPWVGGAGKNKLPLTVDVIKAINASGTWSGNVYSENGATITILTDSDNNVTGIKAEAPSTPSDTVQFNLCYKGTGNNFNDIENTSVTMNGCPSGGSENTYYIQFYKYDGTLQVKDTSGGVTFTPSNIPSDARVRITIKSAIPSGGVIFYPMIRLATETDATFAPYTNICSISGNTEASVQRDGDDVWNGDSSYAIVGEGYIIPKTNISLPAGTYELYFDVSGQAKAFDFMVYKNNSEEWQNKLVSKVFDAKSHNIVNFTINEDGTNVRMYSNNPSVVTISNVRLYSTTQTCTIALGDTIYGGTLRIDSNGNTVMDVDRATVEYDGSEDESWSLDTSGENYFFTIELLNRDLAKVLIANNCENVAIAKGNTNIGVGGDARYLRYRYANDNSLTVSDLKTFLASNNLQICYYLATPTTIQLTPQQIQLLKGTNTLTASTGQISVTVNGVSGSIGAVTEQVNATDEALAELAEKLPTAPTTDGAYVLTVTVADGTPAYSWESAT